MTVVAQLPSGRLVAGGDSQGFFVSDDGGRTWRSRNVIRGGADPFGARGVASLIVANVIGPSGPAPTLFAAVGKRDAASAGHPALGRRGRDLGGGQRRHGHLVRRRQPARGREHPQPSHEPALRHRRPWAVRRGPPPHGRRHDRVRLDSVAHGRLGVGAVRLPAIAQPVADPLGRGRRGRRRIVATSRMGLAGSRGGGTLPQPHLAGVWRFAKAPTCPSRPCVYTPPTRADRAHRFPLAERRGAPHHARTTISTPVSSTTASLD